MRTLVKSLVVLFIVTVSPSTRAIDTDEAAAKNNSGRNYNLAGPQSADETVSAKPVILNSKNYILTPEAFQKIAIKALLKYHWKIEANEATRVQGSYIKSGKTYKVELRYTGDTIVVGFVPGFHHSSNGWLRSLAKQVKIEAAAMSRETEALRYLNK
jgi:hypothetical protein